MSELRTEPLSGRQVLLATDRAGRPHDVLGPSAVVIDTSSEAGIRADCPFCAGNEHTTTPTLWQWPTAARTWATRVVANKYPAFSAIPADSQLHGIHEVLIESPRHCAWMTQLSDDEWRGLATAWQARLADYRKHDAINYHALFKNVGYAGGASLLHVHSQAIAMPMVPRYISSERERLQRKYRESGRCASCDLVAQELASDRVVYADDDWLVVCPAASRQAYETWLIPRVHEACFASHLACETVRISFTDRLRQLLVAIERLLPGEGYNLLLVTYPADPAWHWRIEIVSRTAAFAGFELASGMYLCTVDPAIAAMRLRGAW